MPSNITAMQRDIIRNRVMEVMRLRNMNPAAAFHDIAILDLLVDNTLALLNENIDLERRLQATVIRSVSHAGLGESHE